MGKLLFAFAAVALTLFVSSCAPEEPTSLQTTVQYIEIQKTSIPTNTFIPSPTSQTPTIFPTKESQIIHKSTSTSNYTETPTPRIPINADPRGQKILFWDPWEKNPSGTRIAEIVHDFNDQNEWGIEIILVEKENYSDLEYDLIKAISIGQAPNLIIAYPNVLSKYWLDGYLTDLQLFVYDHQYGFSRSELEHFFPATVNAGLYKDFQIGFPISQSANVIFYNRTWAEELGFPTAPTTPQEFQIQACTASRANDQDHDQASDGTGGFVVYPGAANTLSWLLAHEGTIVNEQSGQYSFDNPIVFEVSLFLKNLIDQGCAYQTDGYPNSEFATRRALFTTSSSVGCQYQIRAFENEGVNDDEWELIGFPGPSGDQAVVIFPQMVGIIAQTPEEDLATWMFIKYLTSPEVQAKWVVGSQYYPVRIEAIDLLGDFLASNPEWASGLSLLRYGQAEPTRPSWELVRNYIQHSFSKILESPESEIQKLLLDLDVAASEALAETEQE